MIKTLLISTMLIFVVMTNIANAGEIYVGGGALMANLSDVTTDNLGGNLSVGYDADSFRIEVETSQHCHLGNCTAAIMGMACVDIGNRMFVPYGCLGGGSTVVGWQFDKLVIQGTVGVALQVTDSHAITVGYSHRCYNSLADFCNSRDGAAVIGLRARF